MLRILFIFLAVQIYSYSSSAIVDNKILNYFNRYGETQNLRVLILLKNKINVTQAGFLNINSKAVRRALYQNADQSQQRVLSILKSKDFLKLNANQRINRYWLSNVIAGNLNSKQIRQIAALPEVQAVVLNQAHDKISPSPVRFLNPTKGFRPGYAPALDKVGVSKLAKRYSLLDGRGVTVGIIDSGIDANHPDLKNQIVGFKDFVGRKTTPYDDYGHGTHVAGLIVGSNKTGIQLGSAPGAKIVVAKALDAKGSAEPETLLQAMEWMTDPDGNPETDDYPRVINNSWGGTMDSKDDPVAVKYCEVLDKWTSLGILPVVIAGNYGPKKGTILRPGNCPAALTVGASDFDDKITYFSSQGPALTPSGPIFKPDVTAPGLDILSTMPDSMYGLMSGTSMAAPIVSGLAAVLIQANHGIDVRNLKRMLIEGAVDRGLRGPDLEYGFGRVDISRSLAIPK